MFLTATVMNYFWFRQGDWLKVKIYVYNKINTEVKLLLYYHQVSCIEQNGILSLMDIGPERALKMLVHNKHKRGTNNTISRSDKQSGLG